MQYLKGVSLRDKSSFGIGGPAQWYCEPSSEEEIAVAIGRAEKEALPVLVLGRGSNMLISDEGWPGLVMVIGAPLSAVKWEDETLTAQAGAQLDVVVQEAVARGLGGIEELSGIPGTVGGAVIMNAGAFSATIADTIEGATWLDCESLQIITGEKESLGLGYRTSSLREKRAVVLSAGFFCIRPTGPGCWKYGGVFLKNAGRSSRLIFPTAGVYSSVLPAILPEALSKAPG